MKAIRVKEFGSSAVLTWGTEPRPTVGEQEVLIRVKASGVGRVDISARQGHYAPLSRPGFIPGIEAAGEVIILGKNVPKKWLGKKVFVRLFQGGYAEEIAVPVAALIEIPDQVTELQAVAFGVNALVASFSLDLAGLRQGDRLLVRGATGGIGTVASLIAQANGVSVTAGISSASKIPQLKKIGIKEFLKHNEVDNTSSNYNAILDLVLGGSLDQYVNLLANKGNYIIAGGAAGIPDTDFGMSFLTRVHRSLSLHVFSLNAFSDNEIKNRMDELFKLVMAHSLIAPVHEIFSLKNAAKAHELMETGTVFGKILLEN